MSVTFNISQSIYFFIPLYGLFWLPSTSYKNHTEIIHPYISHRFRTPGRLPSASGDWKVTQLNWPALHAVNLARASVAPTKVAQGREAQPFVSTLGWLLDVKERWQIHFLLVAFPRSQFLPPFPPFFHSSLSPYTDTQPRRLEARSGDLWPHVNDIFLCRATNRLAGNFEIGTLI